MNLYLEANLANHRHGRFFQVQLDSEACSEKPNYGMVLMHGNAFQACKRDDQDAWLDWCKKSGRTLLLVPPFDVGVIYHSLDWQIVITTIESQMMGAKLPKLIAEESTAEITGSDGEFTREHGDQWQNFTINTRYFKSHSRTGQFAATCLPLWSVSLMDFVAETKQWLSRLHEHAGTVTDEPAEPAPDADQSLNNSDYAALLIAHVYQTGELEELESRLKTGGSIFRMETEELRASQQKLAALNFINASGLTESGSARLEASPYAIYAETLAEEYHREAS